VAISSPTTWRGAAVWIVLAIVVLLVIAWVAGAFESPAPTPVTVEEDVVAPPPTEPEPEPEPVVPTE
jgi:hypothetical protein